jgi:hypothetical protein
MAKKSNNKFLNNNENLPVNYSADWTPEMLDEFHKCANDINYFAENYFFIVNLDEGIQKIKLHDVQKEAIKTIIDNRFTAICASRQVGKRLALDTPVPSPSGWTTMGDLKAGDVIFDWYGNPTTVTHAHEIRDDRNCYKVVFSNGESIVADEEHEWFTQSRSERKKKSLGSVKTTKQIKDSLFYGIQSKEPAHRIPYKHSVQYPEQNLPIDPYLFGYWLGDGAKSAAVITIGEQDIEEAEKNFSFLTNKTITKDKSPRNTYTMRIQKDGEHDSFVTTLKELNVFQNKHIPLMYLQSSEEQRLELLRGLLDSDGYCNMRGTIQFYSVISELAENVKELLYSLGIQCSQTSKIPKIGDKKYQRCHILTFKTQKPVFRLKRKADRQKRKLKKGTEQSRNEFVYIKDIIPIESVATRCITVDNPDSMYLVGKTFIPTHNTTIMTIICLWYCLFKKHFTVAVLANREEQAKEILERIKTAYEEIPNWLKAGVLDFTKENLKFGNKSKIFVSTTSLSSIRGKSVNLLFLDEFAFVRKDIADEFYKSIIPTTSSSKKSKIVCVSTPNGADGRFYDIVSEAERGKNGWVFIKMYWHQIPGRDEEWKQVQLGLIGGDQAMWDQEYDIKFLESGTSALNAHVIETLKNMCHKPKIILYDGDYKIWKEPEKGNIYVFGIDVAQGVGQDSSVCHVIDVTDLKNIELVASYASNRLHPNVFAERINEIIPTWGRPFICIESNKEGAQVLDDLMTVYNYDNIVYYNMENDTRGYYQKPGIFCHPNSKYTGVTNMKYWLETLQQVSIYDMDTVKEFETFIRKENKTWCAKKGKNDDRVMAIIWALVILVPQIAQRYFDILDYDDMGKPSLIKDPNRDQAMRAFRDANAGIIRHELGYSAPSPVMFNTKFADLRLRDDYDPELVGLMQGGWKIL